MNNAAETVETGRDQGAGYAGGGVMSNGINSRGEATAMLPVSALECGVCLSLVCQPVSLSCGHSFCRVCLINTLRRNKKKCPTCRAVCHNSAEDQPEDVMIANIARACFPDLYERRLSETQEDRQSILAVLPIFYYNLPMFPGETLSLHLFEPRYKLMMQRIVSTSRKFAYVPNYTDYTAKVGDVALVAEVCDCEFLSDGRVLIVAKLASRRTVVDHFVEEGTQGLHYCRLEPRSDAIVGEIEGGNLGQPNDVAAAAVAAEAVAKLGQLHDRTRMLANTIIEPVRGQVIERYGEMPSSAEGFSLWIAAVLPLDVDEKHAMLSGTSTMERLVACDRHLSSLSGSAPPAPRQRRAATAAAEAYVRHVADDDGGEEAVVAAAAAGPAGMSAASGTTSARIYGSLRGSDGVVSDGSWDDDVGDEDSSPFDGGRQGGEADGGRF